MKSIIFGLITVLTWGFYNTLYKPHNTLRLNLYFTLTVMGFVVMVMGLIGFIKSAKSTEPTMQNLIFGMIMGFCLGTGCIFCSKLYESGVSLSVAVPLVSVGVIAVATAAGIFWFKEPITLNFFIGLLGALICAWFIGR